jgi:predicted transcriptional regulator of viral defense system
MAKVVEVDFNEVDESELTVLAEKVKGCRADDLVELRDVDGELQGLGRIQRIVPGRYAVIDVVPDSIEDLQPEALG